VKHQIQLTVNGRQHNLLVDSQRTLLEVVRDELKLFGARESCGMSLCGACTVLVDDVPVSSCSYLAARADGKSMTTIEGLGTADNLHPVQRAFLERDGLQCSYCTPGMMLMTVALLRENPRPVLKRSRITSQAICVGVRRIRRSSSPSLQQFKIQNEKCKKCWA
jgi:aerobic carbon-monoxide dehydrogenase small subunit